MKLSFWGAARQVTGSSFLLETQDGFTILIDCGLDLEKKDKKESYPTTLKNQVRLFPYDVADIDLVILTHAHVDHSGLLPNLLKEDYEGQILCTSATSDLTQILLNDSARIHHKKLQNIHSNGRKLTQKEVLNKTAGWFMEKDVTETMGRFVTLPFQKRFKIKDGLWVTFFEAGHLLGAASVFLEVEENGTLKTIGFSGDLGRKEYPLLEDPVPFPEVDFLICESTYGNRQHEYRSTSEEILSDIIKSTCIDIPGRLIIPSFSVGRTQALLYTLNKLNVDYKFPSIKVFSDSPMAKQSSKVYEKYHYQLNKEAKVFYDGNEGLFDFSNFHFVESIEGSRALSNYYEPCIIISSSGMVQGGRVEHHVAKNLENPFCSIFMVGYCADGTFGRKLLEGRTEVRMGSKAYSIQANIVHTDVFSGHADQEGIFEFLGYQSKTKLKKLFLVHGEEEVMIDFRSTLLEKGFSDIEIPYFGQSFVL